MTDMIMIRGHKFLEQFLIDNPGYNVVLIHHKPKDESYDYVDRLAKDYTFAQFHDITQDIGRYKKPTIEDIKAILDWAETRDGPFVVSCAAGISRSSATALLIAYSKCRNIEKALKVLNSELHQPNKLIVKIGSELMNVPELYESYLDWMNIKVIADEVPLEIIN